MKVTATQLHKMGEVADELRGEIELDTTNLHDGKTIVMRGRRRGTTTGKPSEILVTANGQTADLARL